MAMTNTERSKKYRALHPEASSKNTEDRRRHRRLKCIEYKGGKCEICGYDNNPHALEFHHVDSSTKLFNLNQNQLLKRWDTIRAELDKCMLLCANCHRELHYPMPDGLTVPKLLKEGYPDYDYHPRKRWTQEEIQMIKDKQLPPGRTAKACVSKRYELGYTGERAHFNKLESEQNN